MGLQRITTVYLVTGILSNLRGTLAEAIATGEEAGINVRILDLVHLIPGWHPYPNPWQELGVDARNLVTPKDEAALHRLCNESVGRTDLFLFLHLPEGELSLIWKRLQRHGAAVGAMTVSLIPIHNERERYLTRRLINSFRQTLRKAKSVIKPKPDIWVISGHQAVRQFSHYFRSINSTHFLRTHSPDYEAVRKTLGSDRGGDRSGVRSDFILFLDQGWHSKLRPDFFARGLYPPTQREVYGASIRRSLGELQRISGKQVVVSAHPKADLAQTRSLYNGLTVSTDSSAMLSSVAGLIVGNSTTSLQYAAIYHKPIVLFTSDELNDSIMTIAMRGFQKSLSAQVVNIDREIDWQNVLAQTNVDLALQRRFLHDIVGDTESNSMSMWQKVFSGLATAGLGESEPV